MEARCGWALVFVMAAAAACSDRRGPTPAQAPTETAVSAAPGAAAPSNDPPEARTLREALVREVTSLPPWDGAGPWDARTIAALRAVPRHLFVPGASLRIAYGNTPVPIGHEQTISQPQVVAMMTHALELRGGERVLEIGTGSGYQAAVLSGLCRDVYTIEIVAPLGEAARERLATLGYANVHVKIGDGYQGWPEHAPFDRVIVTAAPPEMPKALVDQLAVGGILVAPVGELPNQVLVRWKKSAAGIQKEVLAGVSFVPMVPGSAAPR